MDTTGKVYSHLRQDEGGLEELEGVARLDGDLQERSGVLVEDVVRCDCVRRAGCLLHPARSADCTVGLRIKLRSSLCIIRSVIMSLAHQPYQLAG